MQIRVLLCWMCFCGIVSAQVFDKSPTASSGAIPEGTGQALYGGFGLNAADGPAYNIYRKYGVRDPDVPLQEATNEAGNPSAMNWTGLHHTDGTGIIDPGIWIATEPASSSPADQLLYMRPLIDEVGGGGGDSNFRRDWDVRFGFLEDPTAFIDSRDPNSEQFDLWSGEWDTDGVSAQLNLGTNDSDIIEDEWYTRMGNGFRLNAKDDVFDHEGSRDANPMDRVYAGSDEEVFEAMNQNAPAGVGYDDAIEVSWQLELNDPGNPEPVAGREVKMTVKVGNIIHTGVFDPGSADDPVEPNIGGEEFSDGFFDWENSTPVFFAAALGGSIDATGTMGVFIPGDFNADGVKDDTDRGILTSFLGQTETTYSRGDLDQDGDTDDDDLAAFDPGLPGDFNGNGVLDSEDIDMLVWESASGDNKSSFDLNADLLVNGTDVNIWAKDLANTWIGDADVNGEFNSGDFVTVFTAGKYELEVDAAWTEGDWTGDHRFNSGDFVAAFTDGGYELGPAPAAASVPEPSGLALVIVSLLGVPILRRWYRHR